jgi:predicted RNase H-like HicB family nuclease
MCGYLSTILISHDGNDIDGGVITEVYLDKDTGLYVAKCKELKCYHQGETEEEAIANLCEIITDVLTEAYVSDTLQQMLKNLEFIYIPYQAGPPMEMYGKYNGGTATKRLIKFHIHPGSRKKNYYSISYPI